MSQKINRLVLGISGASGMIYPIRLLKALPENIEIHLVFSELGKQIMKMEVGWDSDKKNFSEFRNDSKDSKFLPGNIKLYRDNNHYAPIASGSYKVDGMIVCPCSMKTLSGIANGYADTLIERAADVNLKEKRPVILVIRETPFNRIHMENMLKAHDSGAVILPANPAFYQNPKTIDDLADFIAARIMNLLQLDQNLIKGWRESD
jgi:4-hydroxy-3-polyprenylbenzoate decarboxylase